MSNIEEMIDKIEEKCLLSTYATDSDNIYAGEVYNKIRLPDTAYPRLEYNIHGEDNFTYVSQVTIEPLQYFDVSGYYRNSDIGQGKAKLITISLFARETLKNIFSINNDHSLKPVGVPLITGFVRMYPIYHMDIYHETDNKHTSFRIVFAMEVSRRWDSQ